MITSISVRFEGQHDDKQRSGLHLDGAIRGEKENSGNGKDRDECRSHHISTKAYDVESSYIYQQERE